MIDFRSALLIGSALIGQAVDSVRNIPGGLAISESVTENDMTRLVGSNISRLFVDKLRLTQMR